MSARLQKARDRIDAQHALKIVASESETHVIIGSTEIRSLLLSERHAILIRLAAIDKVLKLSRKCKKCGNDL